MFILNSTWKQSKTVLKLYFILNKSFLSVGFPVSERGCYWKEIEGEDVCSHFKQTEVTGKLSLMTLTNFTCFTCDTTDCNKY